MKTNQEGADRFDVIVAGGGPAGLMAAVSAARQGCKTALIEKYGFFGGAATACLVVPISGFYKNGQRVVGGLPWELITQLQALGAAQVEMPKGHISVDPEYYKLTAQRLALGEKDLTLFMNSVLCGAVQDEGHLRSLQAVYKDNVFTLSADVYIDATGDGDLCAMAGIPMEITAEPQPLSLCFELIGVDTTTPLLRDSIHHNGIGGRPSANEVLHRFLNERFESRQGPLFGGPWFNTLLKGDRLAVNMTRNAASVLDSQAFSRAEMQMREDMFRLVDLLKGHYPEFRNAVISSSATAAGVREGRHLKGLHRLSGDEILNATPFEDTIARCAHIIDVHLPGQTTQTIERPAEAGYIPWRSLLSAHCGNLICAGRLISADVRAHACIRVQGTCMAIGQAAGLAAALAVRNSCSVYQIPVQTLRKQLQEIGGIV